MGFYVWKIVPELSVSGLFQGKASDEWVWKYELLTPLGSEFNVLKHPVPLGEMLTLEAQAIPREALSVKTGI